MRSLVAVLVLLVAGLLAVTATTASAAKLGQRTLREGSRGTDVRQLQRALNQVGQRTGVDGHFGRGTVRAVAGWENESDRRPDGVVTPRDGRALKRASRAASTRSGGAAAGEAPTSSAPATGRATLDEDGLAVPPADAPEAVKQIIAAGNEIAKTPYRYGGGHNASFRDSGYDCSGSVSYALHGAGLLDSPMASGGFVSWEAAGAGQWVTTYANSGHVYMVVAGLRFDTSSRKQTGNRWNTAPRSPGGFVARHPRGL